MLNKSSSSGLLLRTRSRGSLYQENQRQRQIYKENQYLVNKIAAIQKKRISKTQITCAKHISILGSRAAKWEQEKIIAENTRILLRILQSIPTVSKKKQESDYKMNMNYMERLQRLKCSSYESLYLQNL